MAAGPAAGDHRGIARLMLFVCRPYHLSEEEADRWMQEQAAQLALAVAPRDVHVSRLQSPAASGRGNWDWLIEIQCPDAEDAQSAAREEVLRDLVGDLRLLGMRPSLALADHTRALEA